MGISYSGESKDTVDVMKTAKKAGATAIAITNFKDSPISRYADILICTSQEAVYLRECHILADASASDRGHAVYGDHSVGL